MNLQSSKELLGHHILYFFLEGTGIYIKICELTNEALRYIFVNKITTLAAYDRQMGSLSWGPVSRCCHQVMALFEKQGLNTIIIFESMRSLILENGRTGMGKRTGKPSSRGIQVLIIHLFRRHEKTCLVPFANNKGADQPAHSRSLISAFVFRCLGYIIPILAISKNPRLSLAFVAEQVGLSLTWFHTSKDRFSRDGAMYAYLCFLKDSVPVAT